MPFSGGIAGAHGDSMHQDDAKRDTALGLAGLDAAGDVLALGANVVLTRNGSDEVELHERTSGEVFARWVRAGVNDYAQWLHVGAVAVEILHAAMKNVANGVAGLDGSAKLNLAQMPDILNIYTIADNTLHAHDAALLVNQVSYTKYKTITIDTLIPDPSTLRIKFDLISDAGSGAAYGKIYKNGAPVGVERDTVTGSYETFTEDLSFAEGDTIELWSHCSMPDTGHVRNFRVCGVPTQLTLSEAVILGDPGDVDPLVGVNS